MLKKIVFFALVALPVVAFAQEKIAYLNRMEVIAAMPEYQQMQDSLERAGAVYQTEIQALTERFNKEYVDYLTQRDTLNESIRVLREQELDDMRQRAENYQQYFQQKQDEAQQAMSIPILTKFQKAVDDVSTENNFLYVIDSQAFIYTSPNATNATPLVRRKLGIQ